MEQRLASCEVQLLRNQTIQSRNGEFCTAVVWTSNLYILFIHRKNPAPLTSAHRQLHNHTILKQTTPQPHKVKRKEIRSIIMNIQSLRVCLIYYSNVTVVFTTGSFFLFYYI